MTRLAPLTAGTYLRLRREAARFTLRELALSLAAPGENPEPYELMLARVEIDRGRLSHVALHRIAERIRLDPLIYEQLADGLPTPPVCRACGCSFTFPCMSRANGPCSWADHAATRCTACERKAIAA